MISQMLKKVRQEKGVTAKAVADELGILPDTYRSYETGRREPNLETLIAIANYYNVSIDYLLGRPTAPEPKTPEQLLATLAELKNFDELEEALFEQYMQLPPNARERMIQFMHSAADMAASKKRSKVEQSQKECARTAPAQNTPNTPDTELMQESPVIDDEP